GKGDDGLIRRINLHDSLSCVACNVDIALAVDLDTCRVDAGKSCQNTVRRAGATTGNGRDNETSLVDAANAAVGGVRDKNVARTVESDVARIRKTGIRCKAAVAGEALRGTCERGHHGREGVYSSNLVVAAVGQENVACAIERDSGDSGG